MLRFKLGLGFYRFKSVQNHLVEEKITYHVAEDTVVDLCPDGIEDDIWSGDVHVCDPHAQHFCVIHAGSFRVTGGVAIPLGCALEAPVHHCVERRR